MMSLPFRRPQRAAPPEPGPGAFAWSPDPPSVRIGYLRPQWAPAGAIEALIDESHPIQQGTPMKIHSLIRVMVIGSIVAPLIIGDALAGRGGGGRGG